MQGKGLIVAIHQDQEFPEAYLKLALKEHANAFGGVIYDTSEGKPKLLVSLLDSGVTIEQVKSIQDQFKGARKILYFAEFPAGYSGDAIQPFTCLEDETNMPLLVAFMEGNYSNFADANKADKSDEYLAFTDMLLPTLQELWDTPAVGKSIDKLTNTLTHDSRLRRSLELMCTARGHLTLMAVNGTQINILKNDLYREYPWGWTSNHLGYTEASSTLPAALRKKLFGKVALDPKPEPTAPDIKPPANKPVVEPPKTDTVVPQAAGKQTVTAILHEREQNIRLSDKVLTIPKGLTGKPRKNWCHTHLGYLPRNWKDDSIELTAFVAVKRLPDSEIKSFQDPRLQNAIGSTPAAAPAAVDVSKLPAAMRRKLALKAQAEATPQPEPEKKPTAPAAPLPIIPKEELKGLMEWQTKYTGYDGKEIIIDPEVMPALAEDIPDYAEQTGRKGLEFVFYMNKTEVADHRKRFPEAHDVLFLNIRNLLADFYKKEDVKPAPADTRPAALRRKAN